MSDKIPVHGPDASGGQSVAGHHAVDPHGNLVLIPSSSPLPDDKGWRWASEDDLAAAESRAQAARGEQAPTPAAADDQGDEK